VEETRLAKEHGYENPVVDFFTATTDNYLRSYEEILRNFEEGEVIVATHNSDTIAAALEIK
jgi:predicted SnoaL-like aldol condensation-catalyzing enzyme